MSRNIELINGQLESADKIKKILINYQKDSKERKTEEYIIKRIDNLKSLWSEFEQRHKEIKVDNTHNYFKDQFFEQTKERFQLTLNMLNDKLDELQAESSAGKVEIVLTDIQDKAISKQANRLQELLVLLSEITLTSNSKAYYRIKESCVRTIWDSVLTSHLSIEISENPEYINYCKFYKDTSLKVEEMLMDLEEQQENLQQIPLETRSENVKLPPIHLPVFDGKYNTWVSYRDLYLELVHKRTNLSSVEKMQFLKTHLRGDALKLIQHLNISDANYGTAWDTLNGRYNNQRILINNCLENLIGQQNVQHESAAEIKRLHDTTQENLYAIQNMGIDVSSWDAIITFIIHKKLDRDSARYYEQSLQTPRDIPKISDLLDFLEKRFQSLEVTGTTKIKKLCNYTQSNTGDKVKCVLCEQDHKVYHCKKYLEMPVNERQTFINKQKLCINCLLHEKSSRCKNKTKCFKCQRFHHTTLHMVKSTSNEQSPVVSSENQLNSLHVSKKHTKNVLLSTAMIKVKNIYGKYQSLRALIDPGSQASFITEAAINLLGIPRKNNKTMISGIGESGAGHTKGETNIILTSHFKSNFHLEVTALILSKLTKTLPSEDSSKIDRWEKNLMLADPSYNEPGPVDIIIGADSYYNIMKKGMKKLKEGILAQDTHIGWILSGQLNSKMCYQVMSIVSCTELQKNLTEFFENEDLNQENVLSKSDEICEKHYKKSTIRNFNGTYTVKIPFKEPKQYLGESKNRATARLLQLEKRFLQNPTLEKEYKRFMQEYLSLNHMSLAPTNYQPKESYYIPHQAVIKEDSTTTKLRVVFDASSKTTNGTSLNDVMYTGPKLQKDLAEIILRWRSHQFVFTADVEKMYRQIKISESDQDFHRVLWRFNTKEPIQEYRMTTIPFGIAAAPYLAIRTLQQLAYDEQSNYQVAAKTVLNDFYVDDLLSGDDSVEKSLKKQKELIELMNAGGFSLHKWSSNHPALLNAIQKNHQHKGCLEISESIKTLGIHWHPRMDQFQFKVNLSTSKQITKRTILSDIARLFDPLGWLAPIMLTAKLIMQDLWVQEYNWDTPLPENIVNKWFSFQNKLKLVQNISIPRWINFKNKNIDVQLFGFCDASQQAYGAVVYSKITTLTNKPIISLLLAKSKVAPIKMVKSLPKLELCGALLLTKLLEKVTNALKWENPTIHAWSDSMVALAWLKGDPNRWEPFVANRVAQIQKTSNSIQWRHVKGTDNPADIVSRGICPSKLEKHELWWVGPTWLQATEEEWPKSDIGNLTTTEGKKKQSVTTMLATTDISNIINRFSSFSKLKRVLSYCYRVFNKQRNYGSITTKELEETSIKVINLVQQTYYNKEINYIAHGRIKESKLISLNPFIDQNNTLRVGGRLEQSSLPFHEKHPIILPNNHHLTTLIIQDAHLSTLHGGNQTTLAYIRRKYWIIKAKDAVRNYIHKCITCFKNKNHQASQLMGQLPKTRITPSKPFTNTGIDYAGPIQIRVSKGRGNKSYKGYICIFICFSTKAIHIEAVSDMTAEAFLAAYRRFTSRRGTCHHIYSDNGTTFVGANKLLNEEFKRATRPSNSTIARLATIGTQWHFIPPGAPHFGGLWEAGVKSIKYHLKRIVGNYTLTFEELSTVLYQIEASLNSRPLYPLSDNKEDFEVITPAHFLIGQALVTPPEDIQTLTQTNPLKRWKLLQQMNFQFWKLWSSEYLSRLQQRPKWQQPTNNIEVGDLVLLKEEHIKPSNWPLARIIETHPGKDSKTRVVTLKCKDNLKFKRPITKICKLPIYQEQNNIVSHQANTEKISATPHKKRKINPVSGILQYLCVLMCISFTILTCDAAYTIKRPSPGLYVEHVGQAQIQRGIFRIELQLSKSDEERDLNNMNTTLYNMKQICDQTRQLVSSTHCDELTTHLEDKRTEVADYITRINDFVVRKRRGLLGKLLQSIFGVNEEVYMDINDLQANQWALKEASNHQATIMLSTLTTLNETTKKIEDKLNSFRLKFNTALRVISDIETWYATSDHNRLHLHILTSYQMAYNYFEDVLLKYHRILEIGLNKGGIQELITPLHLTKLLSNAKNRLPPSLTILSAPIDRAEMQNNDTTISIFGYFPTIEIPKYEIIKVTAIPQKISNETYRVLNLPTTLTVINYDLQTYFEISEEHLSQENKIDNGIFLCSPAAVFNLENHPNCILDTLYQRPDSAPCPQHTIHVKLLIWKQLMMTNTWLFIASKPTTAALMCNQTREDISLTDIGIIQITQDCILKTKRSILKPQMNGNTAIKLTYIQPVNMSLISNGITNNERIEPEEIIKLGESFEKQTVEEIDLQLQLNHTYWRSVKKHQTYTITFGTLFGVTMLIISGILCIKWYQHKKPESNPFILATIGPRENVQPRRVSI